MVIRAPAVQLLGRQRERGVLDRMLEAARDGRGGVLAVYGEPGVGKTALLEYAIEAAGNFRISRTSGVEGEMELAFAALQQLCSPSFDLLDRLPTPQREAIEVGLGLSSGRPPNPFLVGLAVFLSVALTVAIHLVEAMGLPNSCTAPASCGGGLSPGHRGLMVCPGRLRT